LHASQLLIDSTAPSLEQGRMRMYIVHHMFGHRFGHDQANININDEYISGAHLDLIRMYVHMNIRIVYIIMYVYALAQTYMYNIHLIINVH
jgi:hypothetical protein